MKIQEKDNLSFSFSDIEEEVPEPIQIQMVSYQSLIQEKEPEVIGLSIHQKKPNELLYIVFTNYRKDVEEIAAKFQCKIRVSMSSYMISNIDTQKQVQFNQCCKNISNFMNSIIYISFGPQASRSKNNHLDDSTRYHHSPYFIQLFKEKHIGLIMFHNKLYAYSRKLSKEVIKNEINITIKNKMIFPVRYSKQLNNKIINQEYFREIDIYLQRVIEHYSTFFNERNIIAEINTSKTFVYLIGQRQKYLMESKLTIKNVVQSLVCLIIKNTTINQKSLIKFLEKASAYPIHYGKISQKGFMIISKDNILKQIINKSAGFFKYIGITLQDEDVEITTKAKIGIFLIRSPTFKSKLQKTREVCKEKGYDLFNIGNVYYINQVFYQEGMENKDVIRDLLKNIMCTLEENKQKFETMNSIKKFDKGEQYKNAENPLKYSVKGGRIQDKDLSNLMKRDVLIEGVQMKKEYMIAFNVIQTKYSVQYWILKSNGEQGEEIKESQLKPGKFLRGKKRIGEDGTVAIIFEQIITVL